MKRTALSIVVAVLAASLLCAASKKEEMLMNALQDPNPQSKLDKLEAYNAQYGAKEDTLTKLLYVNLVKTSLQVKQFDKVIQYGEKALTLKGVVPTDSFALDVNNNMWKAFFALKEMQKAFDKAQTVIDIARTSVDPSARATYIAPALNLQVAVIDSRSETDPAVKREALQKAVEALRLDTGNSQYLVNVVVLGDKLVKLGDSDGAIMAFDSAMQVKPQIELASRLAVLWEKKGDKEKAVSYLKAAYSLRNNARTAYYIAALVQKNNVDEAMNYLAEAFLINDQDFSVKAVKFLRHLFFNVKNTPLDPKTPTAELKAQAEQLDLQFTAILDAARNRLGLEEEKYRAIMDANHDLLQGLTTETTPPADSSQPPAAG